MKSSKAIDTMVDECYRGLYPSLSSMGIPMRPVYALDDVILTPWYTRVKPSEVDLSVDIGGVHFNIPFMSAAMDTVSGAKMAAGLSEVGGCGVIYRHKKLDVQLEWISQALQHKCCLIENPKQLNPDQRIEDVEQIVDEEGFSTIPVTVEGVLVGIVFTGEIAFKPHMDDPVSKWMKPLKDLKVERLETPFEKIRDRLLNEQDCSVLPIVDGKGILQGVYFMKDVLHVHPATHYGKPLVGMAVGDDPRDLARATEAIKLGVGIIVIDSSHGNCPSALKQAKRIVRIVKKRAIVIAGNVADIDGYLRFAAVGVDAVKFGIGSGSSCTTSDQTGVGGMMWSILREGSYARSKLGKGAPAIIADGNIETPGHVVRALAAGADACMGGKLFVAAKESLSVQQNDVIRDPETKEILWVYYRGMASPTAIKARSSASRYGKEKTAAEGIEGYVKYRGPLKEWIMKDRELIQGGFGHVGARNISELHEYGNRPTAFGLMAQGGQRQISTRLKGVGE